MRKINISEEKFKSLKPLELANDIFNSEAELLIMSQNNDKKVLKKIESEFLEVYYNSLYTISELLTKKRFINMDELVMPEAFVMVNKKIVGFTMPYISNINFQKILDSNEFSIEQKVKYLKEIGEILEKMRKLRKKSRVKDFYLNDIHENNFILNKLTGKINVVDLNSSKIGHNLTGASRYLTPASQLSQISKYKPLDYSLGGYFEITSDTEIYCYIVMIFNYFFKDNIGKMYIEDFYIYLDYLEDLGISKELLDIFSYIYTNKDNKNPYEYLDELIIYHEKMKKSVFERVRTKGIF